MKSPQTVSLVRTAAVGMAIAGLLACAGISKLPPEQRYSVSQLRKMISEPMPRCVKDQCKLTKGGAIQCWLYEPIRGKFSQPEDCVQEYHQWQNRIADRSNALKRRYNLDAATAPTCIRDRTVSCTFFELTEVDPEAKDAMAQALARGGFVPFADPKCMAEVCRWRTEVEPGEQSPYCAVASRPLAAGINVETQ